MTSLELARAGRDEAEMVWCRLTPPDGGDGGVGGKGWEAIGLLDEGGGGGTRSGGRDEEKRSKGGDG
jgi:hypothetical protein